MSKIKSEYKVLIVILLGMLAISWNFISGYNSYDTHKMYYLGYSEYARNLFFADGRIFSGIYILIAEILNISKQNLYIFSNILGLVIALINIVYLKNILENLSNNINKYLLYILSFITIFNFTYVDNMKFIEFPIITSSIFLYMMAAKYAILDNNKLKMFISLLIAVFMYQGSINVFFIMITFFCIQKKVKINRKFIYNMVKIILYTIISILISFLYVKIYGLFFEETNRLPIGIDALIKNTIIAFWNICNIIVNTMYVLPKYFYVMSISLMLIMLYILVLKDSRKYFKVLSNSIIIIISSIIFCIPVITIFPVWLINTCRKTILEYRCNSWFNYI